MDFASALLNSVLNLPNGQVKFFGGEFKLQKNCNLLIASKILFGLVKMTLSQRMLVTLQLAPRTSCKTDFLCSLSCLSVGGVVS